MTRPKFHAAVVQRGTHVVTRAGHEIEDMAANRDDVIQWVRLLHQTLSAPPRLIVFPVLSFTGASRRRVSFDDQAVQLEARSPFLRPLSAVCAELDCFVVTSMVERHPEFPGKRFHTGILVGPRGVLLRQPKVQAPSAAGVTVLRAFRDEYAAKLGQDSLQIVAETPLGRVGCFVESEQMVPEVARSLGKRGAEIIVHPNLEFAAGPPFDAMKRARAFENGVYLLSATAAFERLADETGDDTYVGLGGSSIVGPDGAVLARVEGRGEGFAVAEIDLGHLDAVRARGRRHTEPDYALFTDTYRADGPRSA